MKNKIIKKLIWVIFFSFPFSQTTLEPTGYIKFDSFYDTKEVVSAREGHFLLYPTNNHDSAPKLNFVLFQTRLGLKIISNPIWGAKVNGLIEGDFFGTANGMENTLRLRQSYISMNWNHSRLIIGQTWTPLFTVDVYPKVVSFNTGIPFQPFARMPQIRFSKDIFNQWEFMAAVTMQQDAYQEIGGNEQQINSGTPGIHYHLRFKGKNTLIGLGNHLRTIRPLESDKNLKSMVWIQYGKIGFGRLELRWKGLLGEDMADHLMLGGFMCTDNSGIESYQPTRVSSYWVDLGYTIGSTSFGLFSGHSKNLGVKNSIQSTACTTFSARSPNIKAVSRISGRITHKVNQIQYAIEIESTSALYGENYDAYMIPQISNGVTPMNNIRTLFAIYLFL